MKWDKKTEERLRKPKPYVMFQRPPQKGGCIQRIIGFVIILLALVK